jgi:type VI secretion system secreted protein Hcp
MGLGLTASRRDVLKTGAGLVAAAAVGGVFLMPTGVAAADDEAFENDAELEAAEMSASPLALPASRMMIRIDGQAGFLAQSFQFGVSNTVALSGGGGGPIVGRPSFSEITVSKQIDALTPNLQLWVANGRIFQEVQAVMYRENNIVGRYIFEDVIFTGNSLTYGGDDPTQIFETVSFFYITIELRYGGSSYTWNTETNRE